MVRKEKDRNTLTTVNNTAHAKRRKLLNLAFTDKSLKAAAEFMGDHIDRWDELLVGDAAEDWSQPVNFSERVDSLVFDILNDLCFGKSTNIKEMGENPLKDVPHVIAGVMRFLYMVRLLSLETHSQIR